MNDDYSWGNTSWGNNSDDVEMETSSDVVFGIEHEPAEEKKEPEEQAKVPGQDDVEMEASSDVAVGEEGSGSEYEPDEEAEEPEEEPEEQAMVPGQVAVPPPKRFAGGRDPGASSLRGSFSRENNLETRVARVKVYRDIPEAPARELTGYLTEHAQAMSAPAATATAILGYMSGKMRTYEAVPDPLKAALPVGVIQRGSTDMESLLPLTMAGVESKRFKAHCVSEGMNPQTLEPWWYAYENFQEGESARFQAYCVSQGMDTAVLAPWWAAYGRFHEGELRARRAARAGVAVANPEPVVEESAAARLRRMFSWGK